MKFLAPSGGDDTSKQAGAEKEQPGVKQPGAAIDFSSNSWSVSTRSRGRKARLKGIGRRVGRI